VDRNNLEVCNDWLSGIRTIESEEITPRSYQAASEKQIEHLTVVSSRPHLSLL